MVADKVEVFTRSSEKDSPGYRWTSDGCVVAMKLYDLYLTATHVTQLIESRIV